MVLKNNIWKGVIFGIAYYLIGATVTGIVHWIFGWDNPHGPPTSFVVLLIVLFVGTFRIWTNLRKVMKGIDPERNKGELIVHLIPFALIMLFMISIVLIN